MLWMFAIVFAILLIAYVMSGRAWLKDQPFAQPFFEWIEPIEIALYRKSETLLVGRLLWFGGFIVSFYDAIAIFATQLDLTPITARLLYFIPDDMRGVVVSAAIGGIGLLIGWLRKRTSKPIEIVEMRTDAPEEVKAAAADAEAVTRDAVAAAVEAKAV